MIATAISKPNDPPLWDLVIVIDGDEPLPGWGALVDPAATVIAADGGARHAGAEGVHVSHLVGDLDTLTPKEVEATRTRGALVERFDRDKDFTDFELAAKVASRIAGPDRTGPDRTGPDRTGPDRTGPDRTGPDRTGPDRTGPDRTGPDRTGPDRTGPDRTGPDRPRLLVVGGVGGRFDHELGNVAVLSGPDLASFAVTAIMGSAIVQVCRPGRNVQAVGAQGDIVSLVPLGGTARGTQTTGLHFGLSDADLRPDASRGISNRIDRTPATVSVERGRLLVIEPAGLGRLIPTLQGDPR